MSLERRPVTLEPRLADQPDLRSVRDLSEDLRASMSSAYERVARFIQQVAIHDASMGLPESY